MNNKKVKKLYSYRFKGFGYIVLAHGGRLYHFLWQYSLLVPFMRPGVIRIRKRKQISLSLEGAKVYLKSNLVNL